MSEQTTRILGIVSNCWKLQLESGQSIHDLIDQARRLGFRAVELRQGFLGDYEAAATEAHESAASRDHLADLSRRHPAMQINLAVSLPYCGGSLTEDDPRIQSAVAAAVALARDGHPHLRIVDTETRHSKLNDAAIDRAATLIASLATKLAAAGGSLSIEHGYQAWTVFWSIILKARDQLGAAGSQIRVCLDPCNLLLTEPPDAIDSIVDSLEPADVSMIHLKQRKLGQIQPDVASGDLDWHKLCAALDSKGHQCPWLFEVSPNLDIWENLKRSTSLLFRGIG